MKSFRSFNSIAVTVILTAFVSCAVITGIPENPDLYTKPFIVPGEMPDGYASFEACTPFAGFISVQDIKTVSTRDELFEALKQGGVIYIKGMIDVTDTGNGSMLPLAGGGTTMALNDFVMEHSTQGFNNYYQYKTEYVSKCTILTDDSSKDSETKSALYDEMWTLSKAYKEIIMLNVNSDKTLIGLVNNSGIRGGTISIKDVSNIAVRNLIIRDAYDPFPHHEINDGYNSQWDGITIQGTTKNIWVDHCTFEDTLVPDYIYTANNTVDKQYYEKYQTYDGLLDIKGIARYITVSYCKFLNHDKTMLIGSSDTEKVNGVPVTQDNRYITLHHNYFFNCGQRLPMVRLSTVHIYNNYFDSDGSGYKQKYGIGSRKGCVLGVENNYFGKGIRYSFSDSDNSYGSIYQNNNIDCSEKGFNALGNIRLEEMFEVPYEYEMDFTDDVPETVKENSGAGVWKLQGDDDIVLDN